MDVIVARSLTKRYGDLAAVKRLSLRVHKGEIFGLLGPNGAGKTTTLSMLGTLVKPTSGSATVNGHSITDDPNGVRHSIGFVFQDPSSDDLLSGRENLYLHALMFGVERSEIEGRIDAALELVDLKERQHDAVKQYSGGMRRRLELARGLLHDPQVLFLDEPTLGLDPQTRQHIWAYIKKLAEKRRVSVIMTTHYMDEADLLCDRVSIIDRGRIIALDTPANLKRKLGGDILNLRGSGINIRALRRLRSVKKVVADGDTVKLTVDNAGAHMQEILKVAGRVERVESRSPTLNDVFLHYTGRAIREEEGEGGVFERVMHLQSKR